MPRAPQFLSRSSLASLALGAAIIAGPSAIAQDSGSESGDVSSEIEEAPAEPTKGEKKLAKLTDGRVAGEPVRCIRALPNQRLTVIDKTAYVYGRGRTIYVQRTKNPDRIDRDDILVSRRFNGSQLCRLDVVQTVDRLVGIFSGAVFFDDFVPYTRVESAKKAS